LSFSHTLPLRPLPAPATLAHNTALWALTRFTHITAPVHAHLAPVASTRVSQRPLHAMRLVTLVIALGCDRVQPGTVGLPVPTHALALAKALALSWAATEVAGACAKGLAHLALYARMWWSARPPRAAGVPPFRVWSARRDADAVNGELDNGDELEDELTRPTG
jgi:hypothetical protein